MFQEFCTDAAPVFFQLLDFSIAPPLLYYAYIPIILFSLWFALRALYYNPKDRTTQLFSLVALSLVFLSSSLLLSWIAAPVIVVKGAWQMWGISSTLLSLSTLLFVYRLLHGKSLSWIISRSLIVLLLPIIVLAPTVFNVSSFDLVNCEGEQGQLLLWYTYAYQIIVLLGLLFLAVRGFVGSSKIQIAQHKAILIALSSFTFLALFMATSIWGDMIGNYLFELIAPIGAVVFLAGVSFVASGEEDKKFSIHMYGAQMLIVALLMVMLSLMFINHVEYIHKVALISLILVFLIGIALMKSVQKEIEQRKEIEELATRLKEVNRIMSHDVKGTLGKHSILFRALAEGDFGPVPEQARGYVEEASKDSLKLIDSIMVILQSGHELVFHPTSFDIAGLVREIAESSRGDAEKKGLAMNVETEPADSYTVNLDQAYIKLHVIQNLISNAVNYTLKGNIDIKIKKTEEGKVLFTVKDSGVGISAEDAPKMFSEGGHGAHSTEVNVHSTGYGLYSAKRIVDASGGKIWFESRGIPGEGTTFFVELPMELPTKTETKNNL